MDHAAVLELLDAYGPWALLVILGAAYVKERAYSKDLTAHVLAQAVAGAQTLTAITETVRGLKSTLERLADRK